MMADPEKKQLRKQAEWERLDKQNRDEAMRALIASPQGRKYLFWLLDIGKAIGVNPYTGNALNTAFSCGEQNVGQQIMAHILEVAPKGFLNLLEERNNEMEQRAVALAKIADSGDEPGRASGADDSDD